MAQTRISGMCVLWLDLGDMALGQGHDTSLGHEQQLCEILSRSNFAMKSYGPDTDFPFVYCNLDLWDMKLGQVHDTSLSHGQQLCEILSRSNLAVRSYGPDKDFQCMCSVTMTLGQGRDTPVNNGQHLCEILSRSNLAVRRFARTRISCVCVLWPLPQGYDLGSRTWHTIGLSTTIVWNIIRIQLGSEELWPGHRFWGRVHCDLDLGDMTLGQGPKQQLCEILSRSDKLVVSYEPDTMWTDGQTGRKTDRQTHRRTDRRKGWYLYTPRKLCLRG